jgi:hypothetical protein
MIIIEPFGGLANRMRVISSALELNKFSDKKVKLVWIEKEDLNCQFTDLFQPIDEMEIITNRCYYKYAKATNQEDKTKRIISAIINKFIGIDYCIKEQDFSKYIWNNQISIPEILLSNERIYFQTCQELNSAKNFDSYLQFKPIDRIRVSIEKVTSSFTSNTIGLHIRRKDHEKSIEFSPLQLFIDTIHNETTINDTTNFFLSTDDEITEKEIKSIFGEKIITFPKDFSRSTINGIRDAVVDLFCLSKTKMIYGSFWSSFSDIASRIGQIELITLKK